jgi:transposase-like protein
MPKRHPQEFRDRAVKLANERDADGKRVISIARLAKDLGIADSCLRNWISQAEIDSGQRQGLSSKERQELTELRRRVRVVETENEILKRAAAYFARENVLPK